MYFSTYTRVYGNSILKHNLKLDDPHDIEQQSCFRAERLGIGNIFSSNQVNQKNTATFREVNFIFVDLTKAYDTAPIRKLWQTLEMSPINSTTITAIETLTLMNSHTLG